MQDSPSMIERILGPILAVVLVGALASAMAQDPLTVISHPVHERVSTGGAGGDVAGEWSQETDTPIEWVTFSIEPLNERLLRELNLPQTDFDVAFLLNTQAVPNVIERLEPLDSYMEANPLENPDDLFPGMVDAMTFDGQLYGIPFRQAASGMLYNEALFEEAGVDGPPETLDEFIAAAEALTFTRDDGTQVHGFSIPGVRYGNVVDVARMWDGDFITTDLDVVADEEGMVAAVELLRDFFERGILPPNWTTINSEDQDNLMQTGRVAMTFGSMGDAQSYNTPDRSDYAGSFKVAPLPVVEGIEGLDVGPSKVEFWTMVIPANSQDKETSWDFIRYLSSVDNTLRIALNGNGPVRNSTYEDPQFREEVTYADVAQEILAVARVPLPAFDQATQAGDIFIEEVQLAVLGRKAPQQAMDDVVRRVEPLLP